MASEIGGHPDPILTLESHHEAIIALKQTVETLTGQSGTGNFKAVTAQDLVAIKNLAGVDPATSLKNLGLSGLAGVVPPNTITIANGDASAQDTTSLTAAYSLYEIVLENIIPNTNAVTLELQLQVAGVFQTTGYLGNVYALNNISAGGSNQTTYIPLCYPGNLFNGSPGLSGSIRISNPSLNTIHPIWGMTTSAHSATVGDTAWCGGYYNTAGAITGVKILPSAGTLTSGKIRVYPIT